MSNIQWLLTLICVGESVNYILQTELLTYEDSNALCEFCYDTSLCSIHNDTQNNEAVSLCTANPTTDCWIGLTDELVYDEWYWLDGSPWDYGTTFNALPWASGEPSDAAVSSNAETFARLKSTASYEWYDTGGGNLAALCNYPIPKRIIWDNSGYQRTTQFDTSIGIIDILDDVYVQFDIIIHSWPTNSFGNILHIGNNVADRFPGVWVQRDTQSFYVSFATVKNVDPKVESATINLDQLYHIEIFQTHDHLRVILDNATLIDAVSESHQILYDRNIYLSHPWNETINATVLNLKITSSNSHLPKFNYFCDYVNRFTEIAGSWSIDDVSCILQQTDGTGDGLVTWLGGLDSSSLQWTNYKVELVLNLVSGGHSGIILRAQSVSPQNNMGEYYAFSLHEDAQGIRMNLYNNSWTELFTYDTTINFNTDYILRIDVIDNTMDVYLDNVHIHTLVHNKYSKGSIGIRTYNSHTIFKSLKIAFISDNYLYTVNPTITPSNAPTRFPTISTNIPSKSPTNIPTNVPTNVPSETPFNFPTMAPAVNPTNPTKHPTEMSTLFPTKRPTKRPTLVVNQQSTAAPTAINSMFSTVENEEGSENINGNDETETFSFLDNSFNLMIFILSMVICSLITIICCLYFCIKHHAKSAADIEDNQIEIGIVDVQNGDVMFKMTEIEMNKSASVNMSQKQLIAPNSPPKQVIIANQKNVWKEIDPENVVNVVMNDNESVNVKGEQWNEEIVNENGNNEGNNDEGSDTDLYGMDNDKENQIYYEENANANHNATIQ